MEMRYPSVDVENPNDRVVSRVMFIDSRFGRRDTANLIASGPSGQVHFWNIYKNGVLMAKFRPVKRVLREDKHQRCLNKIHFRTKTVSLQ